MTSDITDICKFAGSAHTSVVHLHMGHSNNEEEHLQDLCFQGHHNRSVKFDPQLTGQLPFRPTMTAVMPAGRSTDSSANFWDIEAKYALISHFSLHYWLTWTQHNINACSNLAEFRWELHNQQPVIFIINYIICAYPNSWSVFKIKHVLLSKNN